MNQKGFANIIILIIVVAAVAGVGGYFVLNRQSPPPEPVPTSTPTQSQVTVPHGVDTTKSLPVNAQNEVKFLGYIVAINNSRPSTITVQSQSKSSVQITVIVSPTTKFSPPSISNSDSPSLTDFSVEDLVLVHGTSYKSDPSTVNAAVIRSIFDTGIKATFSGEVDMVYPGLNQFRVKIADNDYKKLQEATKDITKSITALGTSVNIYIFSSTVIRKNGIKSNFDSIRVGNSVSIEGILNPLNNSTQANGIDIK